MSFKKTTLSAFFWASSQQLLILILNLVISVLMARILEPKDFGLIGMISIFIALGRVLMNGGLSSSLIRTKDPTQAEYSTVFFLNIIFSVFFFACIYFLAPYVALFFEQEELTRLLRIYAIVIVIFSFSTIQFAKLTKELNFKLTLKIKIPSILIGGIVGIYMGFKGYGVWSLVGMYISQAIVDVFQLWFKTGWRPSWLFKKEDFKKHVGFGSKLTASSVINGVFQNIYNVVIGKQFSPQILGYFTRSQTLANLPIYNLQEVLDKVTFPLLATIQDSDVKMKKVFQKIFISVSLIIIPILLLATFIAEPLFRFFLTEKWMPAVPYFQLICLAGIFVPLGKNNTNILKVKGKSGLLLKLSIFEKAIITPGLFLLIPFGIYGLLYFQMAAFFLSFVLYAWYGGRLIGYGLIAQLKDFSKVFFTALFSGMMIWVFMYFTNPYFNDLGTIIIASILYLLLYILTLYLFIPSIYKNTVSLINEAYKRKI
ncbi:MAG: lipopolysaccharide biosynthesis protein [Flavobacteriaceae bacterium]